MDLDIPRAFQEELTCIICLSYLVDPVTISCGHSFCRPCLCLTWENAQAPVRCPVCREPFKQKDLKTNILLSNLASIARQASLRRSLSSEEHMCVTHKETKKIFCEEDKNLLCLLCSSSQGHEAHRHCSTEGAAEEHREKLLKKMRSLWEKIQENQRNLSKERRTIHHWNWYVYLHRIITRDVYRMLHPAFHEEEKQHLETLTMECRAIFQQLKKSEAEMLEKKKYLKKLYKELMKMCQKPDVELLQDLEYTSGRYELVQLHVPQPLNPKLSARPITGLIDRLNQFRVKISFNEETNSHDAMLFDGVRTLMFGHEHENASLSSGRYNYFAAWGTQSFTSGKHYWELDMNGPWDWTLGVCKDSGIRKNPTLVESDDIFLLLCVKEGSHYSLLTTSPLCPHFIEKPLGPIGVFLDFESGSVSFFNVAKRSLIWMYPAGSVNFPVRPFYFTGYI